MKPRKIIAAIAVASVLMSACTPQTATTPATASFQTASGESSSGSIKKEVTIQKANATEAAASKDDKPTAGKAGRVAVGVVVGVIGIGMCVATGLILCFI